MDIPRPSDSDKDRFRDLVPDAPRVQVKAMFGNLGAFVNGNMFAGLFGSAIGVKVGDSDRKELTSLGAGPFGPAERPMGGYLSLPAVVADDPSAATDWITRALDHVAAFPPRRRRPPRPPRPLGRPRRQRGRSSRPLLEHGCRPCHRLSERLPVRS